MEKKISSNGEHNHWNKKGPFQYFPKLAENYPELATWLSVIVLMIVIVVGVPLVKAIFWELTEGRSRVALKKELVEKGIAIEDAVDTAELRKVVNLAMGFLPKNGVYNAGTGDGGSYRDTTNGFFSVDAPSFSIKEVDKSGQRSFVYFDSGNLKISVEVARPHDLRGRNVPAQTLRKITIDGAVGKERFYISEKDEKHYLRVTYSKGEFVHRITASWPARETALYEEPIVGFLRSFQSLR